MSCKNGPFKQDPKDPSSIQWRKIGKKLTATLLTPRNLGFMEEAPIEEVLKVASGDFWKLPVHTTRKRAAMVLKLMPTLLHKSTAYIANLKNTNDVSQVSTSGIQDVHTSTVLPDCPILFTKTS